MKKLLLLLTWLPAAIAAAASINFTPDPTQVLASPQATTIVPRDLDVTLLGADPTGATDSARAIQMALNTVAYSNTPARRVYLPAGKFKCLATLFLPNAGLVDLIGGRTYEMEGAGCRSTFLNFPNATATNGIYMAGAFQAGIKLGGFSLNGPMTGAYNTNVSGAGLRIENANWYFTVTDLLVQGWKYGVYVTNSVFFTSDGCTYQSNWFSHIYLRGADSVQLLKNTFNQPGGRNDFAAVAYVAAVDAQGNKFGGVGIYSAWNECGDSRTFIYDDHAPLMNLGGNYERNGSLAILGSDFMHTTWIGGTVLDNCDSFYPGFRLKGLWNLYGASAVGARFYNVSWAYPTDGGGAPLSANYTNGWAMYDETNYAIPSQFRTPAWDNYLPAALAHSIYNGSTYLPASPSGGTTTVYSSNTALTSWDVPLKSCPAYGSQTYVPGSDYYSDQVHLVPSYCEMMVPMPTHNGYKTFVSTVVARNHADHSVGYSRVTNVFQSFRYQEDGGSSPDMAVTNIFTLTNNHFQTLTFTNTFADTNGSAAVRAVWSSGFCNGLTNDIIFVRWTVQPYP